MDKVTQIILLIVTFNGPKKKNIYIYAYNNIIITKTNPEMNKFL